jgi:hypothetical protein
MTFPENFGLADYAVIGFKGLAYLSCNQPAEGLKLRYVIKLINPTLEQSSPCRNSIRKVGCYVVIVEVGKFDRYVTKPDLVQWDAYKYLPAPPNFQISMPSCGQRYTPNCIN